MYCIRGGLWAGFLLCFCFLLGPAWAQTDDSAQIAVSNVPQAVDVDPTASLVKRVLPSLVNLKVRSRVYYLGRETFLESLGSGVIVSEDGYALTNYHVARQAVKIVAMDYRGKEYSTVTVATDPVLDLALLKLDTKTALPFLSFADSDQAEVGETVLALGNPFSLGSSVSKGVIKDYFSAEGIQTAWPALLLNSQGWLLLSTSGQMDLSIPTRLRVRAADGKEFDARYEAYDKKMGLAFVRIIDWPGDQQYSLDWKPCEWSAGQLVSALSCLDAANQHATVRIYARVAGRAVDSQKCPLLDRDLAPYRGLPILDQDGGLVGIVGSSSNGIARVISQEELDACKEFF